MRAVVLCFALLGCASTDASEPEPRCGAVDAFRVDSETCLVSVRTSLRWCVPDGDEQHWGVEHKCVRSPAGQLHVVSEPIGAEVTGDEGWADLDVDAGSLGETCEVALQAPRECGW